MCCMCSGYDMNMLVAHVLHIVAARCKKDMLAPHLPYNVAMLLQNGHVHAVCAHLGRSFVCHIMLCMVPWKWRITEVSRLTRLASLGALGGLHGMVSLKWRITEVSCP